MSTGKTWQTESFSSDDTIAIGERFGTRCKGGEVFVLSSDLGGGKTTFTKGLARGLGCKDTISSPTFTVSRSYVCERSLELHHFDFYRLNDPGVVAYELSEVVNEPHYVTVIEWGDIVDNVLPEERILVTIELLPQSEEARRITVDYPETRTYLIAGLA
jgi:tRNA threonylcarbamoyladenosine biosynthesis protein TsaE